MKVCISVRRKKPFRKSSGRDKYRVTQHRSVKTQGHLVESRLHPDSIGSGDGWSLQRSILQAENQKLVDFGVCVSLGSIELIGA